MKKAIITVILTAILVSTASTTVFARTFTQADYPTEWTFANGRTIQTFFDDKGNFAGRQENGIIVRLVSRNAVHLPNSYNGGITSETATTAVSEAPKAEPTPQTAPATLTTEKPCDEKPIDYADAVRNEFYRLVNEYRAAHGLRELAVNKDLQGYADIRAEEQRTRFGHARPDGSPAGSGWFNSRNHMNTRYAENVLSVGALSDCPIDTALGIFNIWKESPGHNRHILYGFDPHITMAFGITPRLDECGWVTSGAIFATGY